MATAPRTRSSRAELVPTGCNRYAVTQDFSLDGIGIKELWPCTEHYRVWKDLTDDI